MYIYRHVHTAFGHNGGIVYAANSKVEKWSWTNKKEEGVVLNQGKWYVVSRKFSDPGSVENKSKPQQPKTSTVQ